MGLFEKKFCEKCGGKIDRLCKIKNQIANN